MELRGDRRVLEIGCGNGVAAAHLIGVDPRLDYVAIDRSATAVSRAEERNRAAVERGRFRVHQLELEQAATALDGERFDSVFAINVNVFWTTDASAITRSLVDLLVPGGSLWLIYESPGGGAPERLVEEGVVASLGVPGLSRPESTRRRDWSPSRARRSTERRRADVRRAEGAT